MTDISLGTDLRRLPETFHSACGCQQWMPGCSASQEVDQKLCVVAYASRRLKPTEKNMHNYSSRKLDLLALKWSVTEKFKDHLLGSKFTVFTDNNPLTHLDNAKLGAMEQRWVADLAPFDFELKFRWGRDNGNADAPSRMSGGEVQAAVDEVIHTMRLPLHVQEVLTAANVSAYIHSQVLNLSGEGPTDNQKLQDLQKSDHIISRTIYFVSRKKAPSRAEMSAESPETQKMLKQWKRLIVTNGVLFRSIRTPSQEQKKQPVVPQTTSKTIFKQLHNDMGHQGSDRMTQLARERYYWLDITADILAYCKHCRRCIQLHCSRSLWRVLSKS